MKEKLVTALCIALLPISIILWVIFISLYVVHTIGLATVGVPLIIVDKIQKRGKDTDEI